MSLPAPTPPVLPDCPVPHVPFLLHTDIHRAAEESPQLCGSGWSAGPEQDEGGEEVPAVTGAGDRRQGLG